MHHGVGARRAHPLTGAVLSLALLPVLGACASVPAVDPSSLPASVSERCGDGSHPIEILAADVVIAIDRSGSTRTPTGLDLDGNGIVGELARSEYTDRGDSLLAAELIAVRRLIGVARLGGMRFAIVSY